MAAGAGPALRRARGPADAGRARPERLLWGWYVETVVGPTVVEDDATDCESVAALIGSPGSAGKAPEALELLVDVIIASDEDCSDDPGGVSPVS